MYFFESLIHELLTQLAIWFVVFLRSQMFFMQIYHLLSLPLDVCFLSLLPSFGSGIGG
jgi:hypothetical protein